ncbi:MAG: hypothetical protein EOP04_01855 [Proteobacteria bacterium]|nr:MAG: hypothetical protein EOP04_01855 [Pseudomonadota bacterium]
MQFRFVYHCLDKLVDAVEEREGYREDVLRVCDNCGDVRPMSSSYALTPIDIKPWLDECSKLSTFKAFGPNRCGECIPADAISSDDYFKTPRQGWHYSSKLIRCDN